MSLSEDPIVNERRSRREAPGPHCVRVAKIWSAILGVNVTAEQVIMCMIGLKLGREAAMHDRDNVDDIAGWASLIPEVRAYVKPADCAPGPDRTREYAEDRFGG